MIVVGPERVPTGRRIQPPVAIANVPATILDLVTGPDGFRLPGSSLARLWERGHTAVTAGDTIVSVATHNPREGRLHGLPIDRGPMRSILVDGWHLIVNGDGEAELYDVVSDPWEQADLISSPAGAAKAARARALLDARTPAAPAGR